MQPQPQLKNRSLLRLTDLTVAELNGLLDLSLALKKRKQRGARGGLLRRRHIALLFEKASTRTRCAAAIAAADEGGHTEYLSATEVHLGKKESTADTARVLGRMFDGIFFRGYEHHTAETLAEYAGVPVWNALTDASHPTQALADLLTIRERFGQLKGLKVVYVGDGRNNVAHSLMTGCAMTGMHFVDCTPRELAPDTAVLRRAQSLAAESGGAVHVVHSPAAAVREANVIYTDVWISMGEEDKQAERLALLKPYQVNSELIRHTGNVEHNDVIFLHCLPAFHDDQTDFTRTLGALEVTDSVFEAPFSRVFDQAENRLHTTKAVFVASLGAPEGDNG